MLLGSYLLLAWLLLAKPVDVTVSPRVCIAPCNATLRIRIEAHDANAILRVLVDGANYSRYSEIGLSPNSPTVFERPYKGLPAGEYAVVVDLVRHDAGDWIAGRAETTLVVSGEGP